MNFIDSLTEALIGGTTIPGPMGLGAPQPTGADISSFLKDKLSAGAPRPAPQMSMAPRPMPISAPQPQQSEAPTLANALGSLLRGSGAAPQMAKPAMVPQRAPMSAAPAPQQQAVTPAAQPKTTGESVASFLRAVMEGTASVDPRSPGVSAFAQGASGAFGSRDRVQAREDAAKIAASDRAMKLEDRDLALDDKAFDRTLKTSQEKRAISKDKRDGKQTEISMIKTMSDVMRNVDPQLDIKDRIAVERLVRDEGKRLRESESLEGEELKTKMQEYSRDLQDRLISKKPSVGGPAVPAVPGAAPSAPGAPRTLNQAPPAAAKPSGDGKSQTSPATPTDQSTFDALPSKSWFVNPADGRILQKQ